MTGAAAPDQPSGQAPGQALRLDRALIPVAGPDWESFLQNLLTHDVGLLAGRASLYTGLLSPQGKVIADFILWRTTAGVLIDVASVRAEELRRRLLMYRLRAKVEIGAPDAGLAVYAALGGSAPEALLASPDPRTARLGQRVIAGALGPTPDSEPQAYRALRVAEGVPDLAYDSTPEEVFALEALFEEFDGVDFQKGCFVGQENVSRMKRRATTRKKFCRIAFEGAAPAFGAPITAKGVEVGHVRTAAGTSAIALMRLDRVANETLLAEGRPIRLDPPDWLIQPKAN